MVKDNEKSTKKNAGDKEGKGKGTRLFGVRKPKKKIAAPTDAQQITLSDAASSETPIELSAAAVSTSATVDDASPLRESLRDSGEPTEATASNEGVVSEDVAVEPEASAEPDATAGSDSVALDEPAEAEQVAEAPAETETSVESAVAEPVLNVASLEALTKAAKATTMLIFQAPPALAQVPASEGRGFREDRGFRDDRGFREDRGSRDSRDLRDNREDEQRDGVRRRSRRRSGEDARPGDNDPNTVVKVRQPRPEPEPITEPQRVKGSTRLEAKKQRRRDGRDAGRRRPVITEAEFLARREAVDRVMVVRSKDHRIQIGVLEDGVLVEHYVARSQEASLIGNVYLGKVQNVLPSMEAAFVDIGRGRNAVLYSGEVDWEAAAAENTQGGTQPRRIELALKPGATVLVQVTKDPVGHKGARLTSQISLPGRYLVYVPNGSMNGISRKLPDTERSRLKKILKEVLPESAGVIVRTAAEGATEEQLTLDVNRLTSQWEDLSAQVTKKQSPALLHSEPDLLIKIVRDVFNEDFQRMVIAGDEARETIEAYVSQVAPDLVERIERYEGERDAFDEFRITEQIEKALDRKVWLPSGGSLVIDRTEAMTVVDVNTGKFVGSGGNLEETVTKNNLEAAEEIVRQLRLRDIGGIIVVDFIDMVLESNRDLVLRRMVECLSRDRTKHQVAEVTSLGLVQMTRKKLGLGLLESFSEPCEVCAGRGVVIHHDPVEKHRSSTSSSNSNDRRRRNGSSNGQNGSSSQSTVVASSSTPAAGATHGITEDAKNALAAIAASTIALTTGAIATIEPAADAVESDGASGSEHAAPREGKSASAKRRANRRARQARNEAAKAAAAELGDGEADAPPVEDAPVVESGSRPKRADNSRRASASTSAPVSAPIDTDIVIDIPAPKTTSQRRLSTHDAEVLLDSVLDALPAPKAPGKGRSKSRRVSTEALSAPSES